MYCGGMTFCPKYPLELFLLPPRLDPKREVYNIRMSKGIEPLQLQQDAAYFYMAGQCSIEPLCC